MILYNYDENFMFTSISEARIDPKNPDNFLIPAKATTIPTGDIPEKHLAILEDNKWNYYLDRRGHTIFKKQGGFPFVCNYIGPLKDDDTDKPKPADYYYFYNDNWIIDEDAKLTYDRKIRNILLASSDFTQLPDAPFTDAQKEEWKVYRQTLRDFFVDWSVNKEFPKKPGA